ncbi:arylsulfatase B-like isoform X3 [Amblyomma americanum]
MARVYLELVHLLLPVAICAKAQPHIIFLLADDLGWDDVSFHGSSQIPTPNLDALAADGIILNSHYVQSSCAPSRAALMTGLYPIRTGMQGILPGIGGPWGLPLSVRILPQYLKELGYEAHLVGKWHLGYYMEDFTPTFRGFDSFYGYYNGDEDYYSHDIPYPLFLMVGYQAVHGSTGPEPLQAPQENVEKFPHIEEKNRTIFAGMVDALDQSVGEIFQLLHDSGMLDNTVIVFSSDNGGIPWGSHGSRGFNWPLRGAKNTLWEGGTRSAAFIWSTLLARNRTVSEDLMHISDWLPTLYAAAGGDTAKLGKSDGQDMWPHLSNGLLSPRMEFVYDIDHTITFARALRYSKYKLILDNSGFYNGQYRPPSGSVTYEALDDLVGKSTVASVLKRLYRRDDLNLSRDWRSKATLHCGSTQTTFALNDSLYLFDIKADPCELHNLASVLPDVVQFMMKRLDTYNASAATPLNERKHTSIPFHIQDGLCAPWVAPALIPGSIDDTSSALPAISGLKNYLGNLGLQLVIYWIYHYRLIKNFS